jgi:DNA-binding MarR family transcriptional regulator
MRLVQYQAFLPQKGLDIIPKVQEAIRSWEEVIANELSDEEKDSIEKALNKMAVKAYEFKANDKEKA